MVWDERPPFGPHSMRKHSRRCHSPRPFSLRHVGVDCTRISQIIDATSKKGFHWRAEIESHHTGCYCPHTGRLDTCSGRLVGRVRTIVDNGGFIAGCWARTACGESDSSAGTGAIGHIKSCPARKRMKQRESEWASRSLEGEAIGGESRSEERTVGARKCKWWVKATTVLARAP